MSITSDSDGSGLLLSVYVTFPKKKNVLKNNKYVEYFLPKSFSLLHRSPLSLGGFRQKAHNLYVFPQSAKSAREECAGVMSRVPDVTIYHWKLLQVLHFQ